MKTQRTTKALVVRSGDVKVSRRGTAGSMSIGFIDNFDFPALTPDQWQSFVVTPLIDEKKGLFELNLRLKGQPTPQEGETDSKGETNATEAR